MKLQIYIFNKILFMWSNIAMENLKKFTKDILEKFKSFDRKKQIYVLAILAVVAI